MIEQLRAFAYERQRLGQAAPNPARALDDIIAVYSSHPSAPLSLHARTKAMTAAKFHKLDVLRLRHRMPRRWYVWSYERALPLVYRALGSSGSGIGSGPGMIRISSSSGVPGSAISLKVASITSPRLWGGMLVAMPTAMPVAPLIRRLGTRDGSTTGSVLVPS